MKKKLLAVWMLVGSCLIYGHETSAEEIPVLHFSTLKMATENLDEDKVEHALNAYVTPLLNIKIDLSFTESELYEQTFDKYIELQDMPDIFFLYIYDMIPLLYEKRCLQPLDNLLNMDGIEILPLLSDAEIDTHKIDGRIYSLPCLRDRGTCLCLEYRVDIAEKYGLEMDKVRSVDDLTDIFSQLKEKDESITPLSSVSFSGWDSLSDCLGVLMNPVESPVIENLYETETYKNYCRLLNEWRHAGYRLNSDYQLQTMNNYVRTPEFFSKICNYWPGFPYVDSADAGETIRCITFSDSYMTTDNLKNCVLGISANTKYPEKAMEFVNLLYTDPYVVNLLTYGIEGEHYVFVDREKKVIDYPKGINAKNSGYSQFRGYQYGNYFLTYLWNGYPEDIWEQTIQWNQTTVQSVAFGFRYDPAPVRAETAKCREITASYLPLLENGIGDYQLLLDEMNRALYDCGLQRIIDEKQRQLDAWMEEQTP